MKKILQKRVIKIVVSLIILLVVCVINSRCDFVYVPKSKTDMKNYQFDIITICTVFAGFSFSVLGLLISLSSSDAMDRLKETSVLSNQCIIIVDSIVMFLISAFISIFFIFCQYEKIAELVCSFNERLDKNDFITAIYIIGIGYLVFGTMIFSLSVKNMVVLMNKVFGDNLKRGKQKAENFLDAANKQKEKMEKYKEDCEKNVFKSD